METKKDYKRIVFLIDGYSTIGYILSEYTWSVNDTLRGIFYIVYSHHRIYEVFDSLNEDTYESGVPECSKILIDDCIIDILDIE